MGDERNPQSSRPALSALGQFRGKCQAPSNEGVSTVAQASRPMPLEFARPNSIKSFASQPKFQPAIKNRSPSKTPWPLLRHCFEWGRGSGRGGVDKNVRAFPPTQPWAGWMRTRATNSLKAFYAILQRLIPGGIGRLAATSHGIRDGGAFLSFYTCQLLHNSFYTLSRLANQLDAYWPTLGSIIR